MELPGSAPPNSLGIYVGTSNLLESSLRKDRTLLRERQSPDSIKRLNLAL